MLRGTRVFWSHGMTGSDHTSQIYFVYLTEQLCCFSIGSAYVGEWLEMLIFQMMRNLSSLKLLYWSYLGWWFTSVLKSEVNVKVIIWLGDCARVEPWWGHGDITKRELIGGGESWAACVLLLLGSLWVFLCPHCHRQPSPVTRLMKPQYLELCISKL